MNDGSAEIILSLIILHFQSQGMTKHGFITKSETLKVQNLIYFIFHLIYAYFFEKITFHAFGCAFGCAFGILMFHKFYFRSGATH